MGASAGVRLLPAARAAVAGGDRVWYRMRSTASGRPEGQSIALRSVDAVSRQAVPQAAATAAPVSSAAMASTDPCSTEITRAFMAFEADRRCTTIASREALTSWLGPAKHMLDIARPCASCVHVNAADSPPRRPAAGGAAGASAVGRRRTVIVDDALGAIASHPDDDTASAPGPRTGANATSPHPVVPRHT